MTAEALPLGSPVRAAWTFVPRARSRPSREDAGRLRAGLESALRAAHGAGVGFRLHLDGGPESSLQLSVRDAGSERWVERALLRAYDPGDWRRLARPSSDGAQSRWSGRRRGLPGERDVPAPETGRLLRALAAAVRSGSRGVSVAVSLRPAPGPTYRILDAWWRPEATPTSPVRSGRPAGGNATSPLRASPGLAWSAAVDVWVDTTSRREAVAPTLAAVRSAWTALDGRPLVLREIPPQRSEAYRSLLGEAELPALLPGWDGEAGAAAGRTRTELGVPLGRTAGGSVVRLPVESDQGRHFAVLGETGMGKSSLLVAVAGRAARLGGLVVLDPLGETAATIRDELLDAGRDPLWVAPGAPHVGMNALAGISEALRVDPTRAERELEDLVHALRRVRAGRYVDASYWGPRLEEMLVRAVRAAALVPGGTLEDAHALLASATAGRAVVPPGAQAEVRELAARVRERPDDAEGARRLLYEVVRNPTLQGMLCARAPSLSVAQMVTRGRIALVSGAAARVGESTARYLLAAYLALVWAGLLAREAPAKTFVLLDEAQWFAHEGLAEMLRVARRCNVHVGVATQSLASLSDAVQDAVRTNVADLVVFRGSPAEAHEVGRTAAGVSVEGVLSLARGEAAVLLGKGEAVCWVRTARLPSRGTSDPRNVPPADPSLRSDLLPSGPPVDAPAERPGAPEVGVRGQLSDRARRLAPGELLEVDVGELRRHGATVDGELRALGGELGRAGAIVRSERGEHGPVWYVAPDALADAVADRRLRGRAVAADSPKHL